MNPLSLSYSYLIGSERSGTSISTLISSGGFLPGGSLLMSTTVSPPWGLGPGDDGRKRHQDRLGVAAGPEAELGAAVVKSIELDVAAAPHELVVALRPGRGPAHVPAHESRLDVREGHPDRAGEGEAARE